MTNPITTDSQQIIAAELELALGLPWQEAEPVAERIAARLASTSPAPDGAEGWVIDDAIVERLARHIYRIEAGNCATLEEALWHEKNWARAIPEAREMLQVAFAASQPVVEKDHG